MYLKSSYKLPQKQLQVTSCKLQGKAKATATAKATPRSLGFARDDRAAATSSKLPQKQLQAPSCKLQGNAKAFRRGLTRICADFQKQFRVSGFEFQRQMQKAFSPRMNADHTDRKILPRRRGGAEKAKKSKIAIRNS